MPRTESAAPAWESRTELLLELVRLDTAYADLYRERARQIAAPELCISDFKALQNAEAAVESLPGDIRRAMDDGKWDVVKKLTDAFLELDPKNPQHAEILKLQRATRFIATKPENYKGIEDAARSAGLLK